MNNESLSVDQLRTHILLFIMAAIMVFLPIFKGGNYPGAMSLFTFSIGVVFLLSICELSYQRDKYWLVVWAVFSGAVLLHAFCYPLFFENERFFIGGLSDEVGAELNSRQLSKIRMLEVWSFFTAMWLFAWRVSLFKLPQIRVLLLVLLVTTLFQALYGVIHFVSGASTVLGLWNKEFYLNDATGTFVNRNHFSGMLAISSPVVLIGLLMKKPLILSSFSQTSRIVLSLLYLILLMLALISSHSRMGMIAAILGLTVCYFGWRKVGSDLAYRSNKLILICVASFLILFSIWFGVGDILQRYTDLANGNSRFDVWKSMTVKVPFNVWLFGAGPGSFEDVFQIIKPSDFSVRFIYAHNDYLEFIFEFGLLLSFFIFLTGVLWVRQFRLKGDRALKAGVYGSFAAISLHSLVDFNLQVPASALFFWFAVGLFSNSAIVEEISALSGASNNQFIKAKRYKSRFPKTKREWLDFLKSD